jgi:uncharacterized repeat protein (TIGR03806 family)
MKTLRFLPFLVVSLLALLPPAMLAQPYGLTSRPQVGPFLNGALPESAPTLSGNWSTVVAFSNLTFVNAVGLAPVPGTNRLIVWEREGRIYSFENNASTSAKTLVLNITNQCQGWDDSGLLGVAFHPGYLTNRYLFCWYTWVTPGTVLGNQNQRPPTSTPNRMRLARFTLDANGVAIPGSETVFIDQNATTVWHEGGGMFFHPDNGFLYITIGDDAVGAHNQRINVSLFSGVIRIDVDRRGGAISHAPPRQPQNGVTANYFIPNDNPFVGQANVLEEFFCIGLRSPHRMTIDPVSRRIFIGDVGAGSREEISIIEPGESGLNFQWDRIEGYNGDLTPPYIGVNKRPAIDYSHSEGFAVIGGYVYRGTEFAADLGGRYLFGDNGSKRVWVLNEGTQPGTKTLLATVPPGSGPNPGNDYVGLSSFGLDHQGELYMCQMSSLGGRIYKLQRGGPTNRPLPRLLSQTGAFTNTPALGAAPGLIPYDVASPLWSDGALKSRWMAIPTNTQIAYSPTGEWTFAQGSVFVKHFELSVNDTNPALRRRLETRLLVRDTNGYVYGATYKWRPDQLEADLLDSGLSEDVLIATSGGGTRTQTWYFPSRTDCLACHTVPAGGVLGIKTRQSNRDFHFPQTGVTDNQLRAWNNVGLFNPPIVEPDIAALYKLVTVTNTGAPLETRVRSYLDANCSHCHRPGGVQAFWDGRFDTPLNQQGIINGIVANTLGISGARNVVPADVPRSIMHRRVNSLEPAIKMPPLAKNVLDLDAVAALTEWIGTLPPGFGPQVLVAQGATWKYLDDGSDQGTGWQGSGFNDAAWAGGPAQLGYGDGDEATVVGGGPVNNRFITTYFRHTFNVTNAPAYTNLLVRILRDDGAVGYLNGAELFRHNMPTGAITSATLAADVVGDPAEDQFFDVPGNPGIPLVEGANVLAVEIHQINNTSSDISFDIELIADRVSTTNVFPPGVTLTAPASGAIFRAGTNVTLAATATASGTNIAQVEFFAGALSLGSDATNPYGAVWPAVPAGVHVLRAVATDGRGLMGTSAPVTITVNASNLPPAVALTVPANGATFESPAPIAMTATASDTDGSVARVEFYAGATKLGEDAASPYAFTWSNAPVGALALSALAIDNEGAATASAIASVTVTPAVMRFTNTLIATGAVWKYLDDGSDQGTAYTALGYNDTAWLSGPGQLGYGDGDEATQVRSNRLDGTRIVTTYFRRAFTVSGAADYTNLAMRVMRDDGVLVYLNGQPVFTNSLPAGVVRWTNFATATINGAAESAFLTATVNPALLLEGSNVVAAEIHQVNLTSSDITFDLELVGRGVVGDLPVLLRSGMMTNGLFRLWFPVTTGSAYVIDASPDLRTWTPVSTNTPVAGVVEYIEVNMTPPWQFYRARRAQ